MACSDPPENVLEPNGAEFAFDARTDRGFCKLCKIALSSGAHAKQHLEGKKHIKERNKARIVNTIFAGSSKPSMPEQRNEKNEVKENATETEVTDAPLIDFNEPTEKHDVGSGGDALSSNSAFKEDASKYGELNDGASSTNGASVQPEQKMDEIIFLNGQVWYKCNPCNKLVNTKDQLQIHQQSPKHLTKVEQWKKFGEVSIDIPVVTLQSDGSQSTTTDDIVFIDGQPKFRCHHCQCNLDTMKMLEIHKQSPKHLKAVQAGTIAGGGVGSIGVDRTIWHTCDVCQKKLNSAQQLRTHMQSHSVGLGTLTTDSPVRRRVGASGVSQTLIDQFSPFKGDIDDIEVVPAGTPLKQHPRQKEKGKGPAECVPLDASAIKEDQPNQARTSAASNTEEINTSTCTETMQVPADIVVTLDTIQTSEDADTGGTPVRNVQMPADIVVQLDTKGNIVNKDVRPFSIC